MITAALALVLAVLAVGIGTGQALTIHVKETKDDWKVRARDLRC